MTIVYSLRLRICLKLDEIGSGLQNPKKRIISITILGSLMDIYRKCDIEGSALIKDTFELDLAARIFNNFFR